MKTELPARDVRTLVEFRVGPISEFEPLPEGLASQAYAFRQGSEPFVVRISRWLEGFHQDAFAWRTFSSADLPIPEVVRVDAMGEIAVCISRRAPGVRVCDLEGALEPSAVLHTLSALACTDTGSTAGFGPFDSTGQAPYETWLDYLLRVAEPDFCQWGRVKDRTDRRHIDRAVLAVERLAPAHAPKRGLIHGDFGAANLLADRGVITALIDWDRALIGDVAYDEANVFFWGEPSLKPVVSALGARHAGDDDWARRLLCYQLRICLQELSESLSGLQLIDVRWLMAKCADLTEQAESLA
ncbi:MAG TPA: aminoglycoside phosphotransferase family protein, partial [Caulobacteraceae bacterium]|nr:aminoglycoside phosphotransferase family protein [Caulobacteraceae bacterium]